MHADRGASQIQSVGDTRRDIVLFIGEHDLELAQLRDSLWIAHYMPLVVTGVIHAAEDAYRAGTRVGDVTTAFQTLPANFQEYALLRIHQFRFPRRNTKERRIKHLDPIDDAAAPNICRIPTNVSGD